MDVRGNKSRRANGSKPVYAPVPSRALADRGLSKGMLHMLIAVAAHDRLGANGQGCWASHRRLAELTGYSVSHVNEYLTALRRMGYLSVKQGNDDRRRRIYSVVYSDEDRAVMRRDGSRSPEVSSPKGGYPHVAAPPVFGDNHPEMVPTSPAQCFDNVEEIPENIFRETGIYTAKREIDAPEGAPLANGAARSKQRPKAPVAVNPRTVGGSLAQFERWLRDEPDHPRPWLESWQRFLALVTDEFLGEESSHGPRAERLLDEVTCRLDGSD